jgi:hypothetical protein
VTLFPLGDVTHDPDISGRIAKWYLELMGYGWDILHLANHREMLDHALRWVDDKGRSRWWPRFYVAIRRVAAVHCVTLLSSF